MADFEVAKKMFYSCYGSYQSIDREYGNLYYAYHVPKSLETEWLDDIQNELREKISNSSGNEQFLHVVHLCLTLNKASCLALFINLLDTEIDSFSRLLYCEQIKDLIPINSDDDQKICSILNVQKNKLLTNVITIDNSYLSSRYLRNYDFSDSNIIERISKL